VIEEYLISWTFDGETWTDPISVTGTSYSLPEVSDASNLQVRIVASNGLVNSDAVLAEVLFELSPPALTAKSIGLGVEFNWAKPIQNRNEITGYVLRYSESGGEKVEVEVDADETSWVSPVVSENEVIHVEIATQSDDRLSAFSGGYGIAGGLEVDASGISGSGLVGTSERSGFIALDWDPVTVNPIFDTSTVTVQVLDENSEELKSRSVIQPISTLLIGGLPTGKPVTIQLQTCARVISENPVCGSWVQHLEQFTPMTWPSSPQQVQVAEVTNEAAVEVSWKEPEDDGGSPIEEYVVEYQEEENPGPAFFRASTIGKSSVAKSITVKGNLTTVRVPNLTAGKRYSISVKAKNRSVDRYSEVVAVKSPVILGFRAPTGLRAVSKISPSATFSWSAVSGVAEYLVVCSGTGLKAVQGKFKTISATLKGLVAGKSYSCNVSSVRGSSTSSPSAAISVKLTAPLPVAPNITSAKQRTSSSATVSWVYGASDAKSVLGFYVETSKDGGKTWKRSALQKASAKSMTITGLAKKSTYQFRVLAVNESGTSPASKLSAKVRLK
jgi:hypothetical protein